MQIDIERETWDLKKPFTTARHYFEQISTLRVMISDGVFKGHGEAVGVDNLGENIDLIADQVTAYIENGKCDLEAINQSLPPGGARNALDCALWDLKCKQSQSSIWNILGMTPQQVTTVFTIPLESIQSMAQKAKDASAYPHLKIKLDANQPLEKMQAIRAARPDATIIIDCNQGWDIDTLQRCAPVMAELGVEMIEQPLKMGQDDVLLSYDAPLPLCADESCNTTADLSYLAERYQMVNIKLDKTGGLSEALKLAHEANELGLDLMVGNMLGSSLGMAPAFVIAQFCKYVDLDGPLLQKEDREYRLQYNGPTIGIPNSKLWG